jgi:tetratricopeptide (TPR) repeat protein
VANSRRRSVLITGGWVPIVTGASVLTLALISACANSVADETNAPLAAPMSQVEEKNSRETLEVLRQVVEQLRSNHVAIEENGRRAEESSLRTAEMFSNGWATVATTFSTEQEATSARTGRELQSMESSNRVTLALGVVFASIAGLSMLILAYFQWRMSKSWAALLTGLPLLRNTGAQVLGSVGTIPATPVDDSNRRLLGVIAQLERRIDGLEHGSTNSLKPHEPISKADGNGDLPDPISAPLENGGSMLKANQLELAIKCFDEVLSINPNHGEALVKKGVALERLKKLNEAFECYDRAIAADSCLTIAYLHKGGLCNRLERFKDALECYEKALETHPA